MPLITEWILSIKLSAILNTPRQNPNKLPQTEAIAIPTTVPVITDSTGIETAAVGLLAVVLVIGVALGINRRRPRPPEARATPPLEVRRAALVGGLVGVVFEATVSARTSAPLLTFASNIAFVLWMALLAVGVVVVGERLKTTRRLGR